MALNSDLAIRWQVLRDLTDADATTVAAERSRVAHEVLGAEIYGNMWSGPVMACASGCGRSICSPIDR